MVFGAIVKRVLREAMIGVFVQLVTYFVVQQTKHIWGEESEN